MDSVIECYENYKEEDRLTTNNSRRIEFVTTVTAFDSLFPPSAKILDCAAGTGVYSFYYAEKGYDVTALDITPRHIEIIKNRLKEKPYKMAAAVNDAVDLSRFADNSFDIVLCMGPMYHLTEKASREKCLSECIRVAKKGGLVAVSYISRFAIFPYVAASDTKYMNSSFENALIKTGVLTHNDPNCFWTDSYFAAPDEMERLFLQKNLRITDHFAQDGISPFLREKIDLLSKEQFRTLCDYHYCVCHEKSILGASNHGMIIGEK